MVGACEQMPPGAEAGNYTLVVEGSMDEDHAMPVFTNETDLIFHPKHVSVFIFTDQRVYQKKFTGETRENSN